MIWLAVIGIIIASVFLACLLTDGLIKLLSIVVKKLFLKNTSADDVSNSSGNKGKNSDNSIRNPYYLNKFYQWSNANIFAMRKTVRGCQPNTKTKHDGDCKSQKEYNSADFKSSFHSDNSSTGDINESTKRESNH